MWQTRFYHNFVHILFLFSVNTIHRKANNIYISNVTHYNINSWVGTVGRKVFVESLLFGISLYKPVKNGFIRFGSEVLKKSKLAQFKYKTYSKNSAVMSLLLP